MRWAGSSGPIRRATAPQTSDARSGLARRSSTMRYLTSRPRMRSRYSARCRRIALEINQQLAEHVAMLQPLQPGADILQREHGVDHRGHTGGDPVECAGNRRDRRAETADDAVLLLEQLHQVDAG